MAGDSRGFAVIGRTILATTDGHNWSPQYASSETLRYVDAVDPEHVWVLGSRSMFATSDGGQHWLVLARPPVGLTSVHFVDIRSGWAVGDGQLFRTSDSGRSWTRRATPCPADQACFSDPSGGWIASSHRLFRTDDGGNDWRLVLAMSDQDSARAASDLQCTPSHDAWVLFVGDGGAMSQEAQVGYHCAPERACTPILTESYFPEPSVVFPEPSVVAPAGPGAYPGPFSAINDHVAVYVGNTGATPQAMMSTVLFSDDGHTEGQNQPISTAPQPTSWAYGASFTNTGRGWIVAAIGNDTEIIATNDGGHTWTTQYKTPAPTSTN